MSETLVVGNYGVLTCLNYILYLIDIYKKQVDVLHQQQQQQSRYFGRLRCVFELAAFRTCNQRGKISLTPLFLEAGLALGLAPWRPVREESVLCILW